MLKFGWNQLKLSEKWGFEPSGVYTDPTLKLTKRRKMQKIKKLHSVATSSWTNCSRFRLFTNCTPLNPTICVILPDRDITKIAETVLVSAICLILPFSLVTPVGLEPTTQWLRVICSLRHLKDSLRSSFRCNQLSHGVLQIQVVFIFLNINPS